MEGITGLIRQEGTDVVKDRASTEKAFTANTAYYRERRRYRSKVTASAVERNYKINGLGAECAHGRRLGRHLNYF